MSDVPPEMQRDLLRLTRLNIPAFVQILTECINCKEFVAEFDRLNGTNVAGRGTSLELQIDHVTGRDHADFGEFIDACWDLVYCRLPEEAFCYREEAS